MGSRPKIHFRNRPFMAVVEGESDEPLELTPVVFDDFANCGIGIYYPDGRGSVWGLMSPRDLITSWRATELVRYFDRIEHGTLSYCYTAARRNPHSSDQEKVDKVIEKVGRENYDRIMAEPIPETIVRAILDNQEKGEDNIPPSLYPIADEVAAGTLEWRQEFADAGISHPDWDAMRDEANNRVLEHFKSLLDSLAKWRGLPRDCMGMWDVENSLMIVVEHGVERQHSDKIAVAAAGVAAEIKGADFMHFMMPSLAPRSEDELYRSMERKKREVADEMNRWLASLGTDGAKWWQIKRRQTAPNFDHRPLLLSLVNECFPAKNQELAEQVSADYDRVYAHA